MIYRPDIDGLRAVAVILVILFHFDLAYFGAGFIGVDIFFVISGYLITKLILTEIAEDRFSFAGFYARRVRRLLPALLTVIFVTIVAGAFLLLPSDYEELGWESLFAVIGASNIYFFFEADYFGRAALDLPLLHTWSLGVEEQFYVIWPLLCVLLCRWIGLSNVVIALLFAVITVASLAAAIWAVGVSPEFAFYMLPTRAWQLSTGALIALLPAIRHPSVTNSVSMLGIGLIAAAMYFIDPEGVHPGPLAVLPVAGAAMLVAPSAQRTVIGRLLGLPVFAAIGRRSYSAYLWHWPVLVLFVAWNGGEMPTTGDMYVLLTLIAFLSAASYTFVEQPFRRRRRSDTRTLGFGAVAAATTAGLGAVIIATSGAMQRLAPEDRLLALHLNRQIETAREYACAIRVRVPIEDVDCIDDTSRGTPVLLLGDSHANHFATPLRNTYPEIFLHIATAVHCRPVIGAEPVGTRRTEIDCIEHNRKVFDELLPGRHYPTILVSARWRSGDWEQIGETVGMLGAHADRVIVFGPTMEYDDDLPALLLGGVLPRRTVAKLEESKSRWEQIVRIDTAMADLVRQAGGEFVSLIDILCPEGPATCRTKTGEGVPIAWDYGHFTYEGAVTIFAELEAAEVFPPVGP